MLLFLFSGILGSANSHALTVRFCFWDCFHCLFLFVFFLRFCCRVFLFSYCFFVFVVPSEKEQK